jgi:hypothetical protein
MYRTGLRDGRTLKASYEGSVASATRMTGRVEFSGALTETGNVGSDQEVNASRLGIAQASQSFASKTLHIRRQSRRRHHRGRAGAHRDGAVSRRCMDLGAAGAGARRGGRAVRRGDGLRRAAPSSTRVRKYFCAAARDALSSGQPLEWSGRRHATYLALSRWSGSGAWQRRAG